MRGSGRSPGTASQGLTLPSSLRYMKKRLKDLEVSERKQVGDTEATVHPPSPSSQQQEPAGTGVRTKDSAL